MQSETLFAREHNNLDRYMWTQQVQYIQDLEVRSELIKQKTVREFNQNDWLFDTEKREWNLKNGVIRF